MLVLAGSLEKLVLQMSLDLLPLAFLYMCALYTMSRLLSYVFMKTSGFCVRLVYKDFLRDLVQHLGCC